MPPSLFEHDMVFQEAKEGIISCLEQKSRPKQKVSRTAWGQSQCGAELCLRAVSGLLVSLSGGEGH